MNTQSPSWFAEQLDDLAASGLRRSLRRIDSAQGAYVTVDGRGLCCFCSNNYLGLANHPEITVAVKEAVDQWGWGSAASPLVSGHMKPHETLATAIAEFKQTEAAIVCSTGYQANLAAIRGLVGKGDVVFLDKLNHASIIDAARSSEADIRVFGHRDYDRLETLLKRYGDFRRRLIVTDTVFSMDGDCADLPRLAELRSRYDAMLCIDEAHATGVFGEYGRGLAEAMDVEDEVDVTVGTLSKALGGIGGFVAGRQEVIDWLINSARSFIYTTALPPAACVGASKALEIVRREPQRRKRLLDSAEEVRERFLANRGIDIAGSSSQIIPIVVGEADAAVRLSRQLEDEGFLIPAIRPPTVPRGQSRLRISLCSEHTGEEVDRLLNALDRLVPPSGMEGHR